MTNVASFLYNVRSTSDAGKPAWQIQLEHAAEYQKLNGTPLVYPPLPVPQEQEYNEYLLGMMERVYTFEQIMSGDFTYPKGYDMTGTIAAITKIVAAIVSYVPVFGTAVAFVLNTAVAIAEEKNFNRILLDGVRGALPGQPVSTMAFDAVRAVANGEPIDEVLIDAIPIDGQIKNYIKMGVDVVKQIADGEPVTDIALQEIYNRLPPDGQRAFDLAKRVANGENVGDITMQEGAAYLKDATQQQINEFIANIGYQQLLNYVPPEIRNGLTAGLATSYATRAGSGAPVMLNLVVDNPETGEVKTRNDELARQGLAMANSDWAVNERRKLTRFLPVIQTDDEWRRGFDIGTAVAVGLAANSPAQDQIRMSIGSMTGRAGFVVGRDGQYRITSKAAAGFLTKKNTDLSIVLQQARFESLSPEGQLQMAMTLGRQTFAANPDRVRAAAYAKTGAALAEQNPTIAAARNLNANQSGDYRYGFDVGTAISQLTTVQHDPPQDPAEIEHKSVRDSLNPGRGVVLSWDGIKGFDVGSSLMFGINKMKSENANMPPDPNVGAGIAITTGLIGSNLPSDNKAAVMQQVITNPAAKAGATATIEGRSFFQKILAFFGL
jgi:hypothetical protein